MNQREIYLKKISLFLGKPMIKVLTGMRRVGKSTLLAMVRDRLISQGIKPQQIVFINMESLEFGHIKTYLDLDRFIRKSFKGVTGPRTIFIDEIQEIEGWEKAAASLLANKTGDLIISGSNAHLLSSDLATLLTGRYVEIPVFPLGFREFLEFRRPQLSGKEPDISAEFQHFLHYGGLPGIHFLPFEDEAVHPYLSSILNTILLKDVVRRYQIRDVAHLERITGFVLDNCGHIITAKSIADYFKSQRIRITVDTVLNYLEYMSGSYLVNQVKRYAVKGKRQMELYEKYYPGDTGLQMGRTGFRPGDISGVLESVVYLELRRRGYTVSIGDLNGREIDFVAEKSGERLYLQIAYLLADPQTVDREFGNLEKIPDHFPKMVLSLDTYWGQGRQGVAWKNLVDFLQES
jgi:uncharacterized protein